MDQQLAGGVTYPYRFEIPDDFVRPLALALATSRMPGAGAIDENWYAAKLEIFERPEKFIDLVESRHNQIDAFRSPTVRTAYSQIRRWHLCQEAACRVQAQGLEREGEFFPQEWIRILAYRRFEQRGRQHGHDKEDWFAAKAQLFEQFVPLMLRDIWSAELCDSLRQKPVDQAIECLRELVSQSGMRPDEPLPLLHRKESKMRPVIKTIKPTAEERERARAASSPITKLSDADLNRYRGCLVALLADGHDKGKVIAHAPANPTDPRQPREAINSQVQSSEFRNRRYVIQQILHPQHAD